KKKLIQDPYSFRCMPQVRGTCEEIFEFCKRVIEEEIECVSDNPLVIGDKVISGGNFIGIRLSFVSENLKKIIAVLSNISERRINHLMGSEVIDMPKFLSKEPGKKTGLMILHNLVVSLLSYIKTLTFPDLSDSIPTSQNQEDYVPMTMNSCLKLFDMVDKFKVITFSELYAGVRACLLLNKKLPLELDSFLSSNFKDLKIFLEDLEPWEVIKRIKNVLDFN
ncbi:MAG: aromatic amino acid lyase, partial [candidate division WOR-3 bacterium]